MFNYRTEQEEELTPEEIVDVTEKRGRDFVPRIDLGSGMIGDGPAVTLYEVLIAQGWKPIDALEEVLRTLIKAPTPIEGE